MAVLDSGVDDRHPQLKDKVESTDPLRKLAGSQDLCGHGTAVAGVIAARKVNGVAFHGLAPNALILSARVSERVPGNDDAEPISPEAMGEAVRWAVTRGAKVINISFAYISPSGLDSFKRAIDEAISKDVVVVAAVGNNNASGNPTPYPAAWPGVVGVAAVQPDGQRVAQSGMGDYVDIAAPGADVTVPLPGSGHTRLSGTSFAAPMVAATAALIFDRYPNLTGPEVVRRLLATADPAPGGRGSKGYGVGVVNPLRAVTEIVDGERPVAAIPLAVPSADPAAAQAVARAEHQRRQAFLFGGIGVLAVMLAVALMVALPAGVRRRWRPAGQ